MKIIVMAVVALAVASSIAAGSAFTRFAIDGDGVQSLRVLSVSTDCGRGSCSARYIDPGNEQEFSLALGYSRQVVGGKDASLSLGLDLAREFGVDTDSGTSATIFFFGSKEFAERIYSGFTLVGKIPLSSGATSSLTLDSASVGYDFGRVRLGLGYSGSVSSSDRWSGAPYLDMSLEGGKYGSLSVAITPRLAVDATWSITF